MKPLTVRLTASLEKATGRRFHVGDHVSWNSEAGRVSGIIVKIHESNFKVNKYTHHATHDKPQYEIRSSKTKHIAYHLGSALTLLNRSNESHEDKKKSTRHTFKTIPVGTKVKWPYRSATGHGKVIGVHKLGTTAANTMYSVHEYDHHVSQSGSKEPKIVYHSGKALERDD